ncbi:MAG: hypothetical protein ACRCX2_16120 [Paraclostridium sp.]
MNKMLKFNVKRPDGTSVDIWHTGNFKPADYLPLIGGTITGNLSLTNNLTVGGVTKFNGQVTFGVDSIFEKKLTTNNLDVTTGSVLRGTLEVQATSTFKNTILVEKSARFKEDVAFDKSITIGGITKFGNGIEITTGVSRFKEKVLVSTIPSFKDGTPTITLALGDSDTGFNSPSDGKTEYYKNGVKVYDMDKVFYGDTGGLFKPGDYLPLAGGTVTGNITYSGDNTLSWVRNTDWFKIGFKNTGDGDTDSYGYVEIGDNADEHFKIRKNNAGSITDIAKFRLNSIELLKNTTLSGTLTTSGLTLAGWSITVV